MKLNHKAEVLKIPVSNRYRFNYKIIIIKRYLPEHLYFNILEDLSVAWKPTSLSIMSKHNVNGSEKNAKQFFFV